MRLTNGAREGIIRQAIESTFAKRDAAHQKARTAFVDALYDATYGVIEKLAQKLPQGWCYSYQSMDVSGPGFMRFKNDVGIPRDFKLSACRLFPPHTSSMSIGKEHDLYPSAEDLMREHASIEDAKVKLRASLVTLVYSVNTTDKLAEAWPRGKKFLPVEKAKVMAVVPASLTENINRLMGL